MGEKKKEGNREGGLKLSLMLLLLEYFNACGAVFAFLIFFFFCLICFFYLSKLHLVFSSFTSFGNLIIHLVSVFLYYYKFLCENAHRGDFFLY